MASIVTIHGTFADGEEYGSDWWQKGSDFERDVRTFVEAEDGTLQFQPFIWKPSSNSEQRRRAAATELNGMLGKTAKSGPYAVVAHSHGGSVAALAMRQKAHEKADLPGLSALITVATPFLSWGKRGFLLSRLERWQQIAYIVLVLYCVLTGLILVARFSAGIRDLLFIIFTVIALSMGVGGHLFFAWRDARRRAIYALSPEVQADYESRFGSKILAFWHASDEAIGILRNIAFTRLNIFQPEFLLGGFAVLYMMLLPFLSFGVLSGVGYVYCSGERSRPCPVESPIPWLRPLYDGYWYIHDFVGNHLFLPQMQWIIMLVELLLSIVIFSIVVWGVRFTWNMMASVGSGPGTVFLNDKVSRAVVERTYGNDDKALTALSCSPVPFEAAPFRALPGDLEDLLSEHADAEAAKTVGKLRAVLGDVIANVGAARGTDAFTEYLTWSELIHTSYFKVPLFRKLVCHAIAHSPGFRPSAALKADPDYDKLGHWLAAIRSGMGAKSQATHGEVALT